MSFFSSLAHFISCRFGLTQPEQSDNILKRETEYLNSKWDAEFIHKHKSYIETDYKNFVDKAYPTFISDHKYAFVDGNAFPAKERPKYALALSGGGIRSAAFGIGVIQALSNADLPQANALNDGTKKPSIFSKLVYLSTVSGGGYAGAALSWCMKKWNVYPFGEINSFCGSKSERPEDKSIDLVGCYTESIASLVKSEKNSSSKPSSEANQPTDDAGKLTQPQKISSNKILSYIRLHGKYLSPPELPLSSLIGSVLNSIFHSFIAYTFLLSTFIFLLIGMADNFSPSGVVPDTSSLPNLLIEIVEVIKEKGYATPAGAGFTNPQSEIRFSFTVFFFCLAVAGLAVFLITSFSYGISSYITVAFSDNYQLRIRVQKTLGFLVKFIFVNIVLMVIPIQIEYLKTTFIPNVLMGPGGIGAGLTALLMSVNEFRKQLQSSTDTNTRLGNLVRDVVVILFIYVLLTLSYLVSELAYTHFLDQWFIVLFVSALVLCFIVNINNISPHRMYRDRLMDTFLTDPNEDTYKSLAKKGRLANKYRLSELNESEHWAPYHLINTNIILNNSRNPQHNSRLGDSFVLSSKYCGSDATGYVPTKAFAFGTMTLATATSISGAAANPHSGVGGIGTSTTPLVSFLMTFFGLRLGYWANNPKHVLSRFKFFFKPNYFFPGITSLINFGHTENSAYIELSDGGHFDNTGIYELIRRRVPWIILSDGSADLNATFEDLGNALSRIRIDFGVTIRFNDPTLDLCGLIPGSQTETIFDKKFNLSARGFAIADIVYPETPDSPAFIGTFVYIKATMTRDLPGDIYAYQADHPEFPNEPTSDQFFNERQFEAYRELGYQLTKQLVQNEAAMQRLP